MVSSATLFAAVLALTSFVDAFPLAPPGRHAPPYLASKIGNHKRALSSFLDKRVNLERALLPEELPGYNSELRSPPVMDFSHVKRASMPSGWTSQGCVNESQNQRLLAGFAFSTSAMDIGICTTICGGMGYTHAGLEYASECYCANELTGSGGVAQSGCDHPCSADPSQSCGGEWRINLYSFNASTEDLPVWASTTTKSAGSIQTGVTTDASSTHTVTGHATTNGTATVTATSSAATGNVTGTATSSTATAVSTAPSTSVSEWYNIGCATDQARYGNPRTLEHLAFTEDLTMTIDKCLIACEDAQYKFAGLQYGQECYCSNTAPTSSEYVSQSQCSMPCAADSTETCGGEWLLDVYELLTPSQAADCGFSPSESVAVSSLPNNNNMIVQPTTKASSVKPTSSASATTSNLAIKTPALSATGVVSSSVSATVAAPAATAVTGPTDVPASTLNHNVWAHHMVGNTYSYNQAMWASDIALAAASGIDGFALNIGSSSWESARVNDAYNAAAAAGGSFKLFLSLDMTSLGCGSAQDAATLVSLVQTFASSSAQAMHNGKVLVSTFSGESCTFGTGNVDAAWSNLFRQALNNNGVNIFFVPSLFSNPSTFANTAWMDGELNWNSGWSMDGNALTTTSDIQYMQALGSKEYMPAISPAFYTHFPVNGWNKNWLYRGDDWLYATRWEQVIAMRESVQMTEILTWNDYGESSYIGPIQGDLPAGSGAWVHGFPHTAWLQMTKYYATAFKTGAYPAITEDSIIVWSRPHPHDASATSDSMSKPDRWQETDDNVYAIVFATASGSFQLTSGSNSETFAVTAGLNKIKVSNAAGSISAQLTRGGSTVASYNAGSDFNYASSPSTYNYNYFVGSSS